MGELDFDGSGFPLRLYCLRLTDTIVILFNGGEKTARTAQGGKTSKAFREACAFVKKIDEAIKNREIIILEDDQRIVCFGGSDEIIL